MEAVHSQIASIQELINATELSIQEVTREIVEVNEEINDVELKMGTATSQKEIDRLVDDKKQLAEDIEQLEEDKKQQAQREKQLRAELVCWSEELTRLTIAVAQREGEFSSTELTFHFITDPVFGRAFSTNTHAYWHVSFARTLGPVHARRFTATITSLRTFSYSGIHWASSCL